MFIVQELDNGRILWESTVMPLGDAEAERDWLVNKSLGKLRIVPVE